MKRFLSILSLAALAGCSLVQGDEAESSSSEYSAVTEKPYDGTCTPNGTVCAYFAPTDMPIFAVVNAMKSAKHTIRIATYNINIPEIAAVLRERMDAGVKVTLMEDYAHAIEDEPDPKSVWSKLGTHANLRKYMSPVLRGGTPQMHDKILVVDGERVYFGSANWTYTGLVGNFENVMMVREPTVVKKFEAELDELEFFARVACETFASPADACGTGRAVWSPEFHKLAIDGAFQAAPQGPIDASRPGCKALVSDREGVLIAGNQPRIADMRPCFVDAALGEKYASFVAKVAANETYVDGSKVSAEPPVLEHVKLPSGTEFDSITFKHRDTQTGPMRVYFGGEDDVEYQFVRELRKLQENPTESFAYLSTNFVTNSRLVSEVAKLHEMGARTRVFFDRGRFLDPQFTSQFQKLSQLGFTFGLGAQKVNVERTGSKWNITRSGEREDEASLASKVVTVFDNDLSGNYGANHNKFAVLGHKDKDGKYRVVLLNGSANWSGMAMEQNDENLVVMEDPYVASIYLREFASQEYVFRYGQEEQSQGFLADMGFVSARVPCFDVAMGKSNPSCPGWKPLVGGALVMAVKNVPAPLDGSRRVWAWVSNWKSTEDGPQGRAFELFSYGTFDGKWVTSIPYAPGADLRWKFITAPGDIDPNKNIGSPDIQWEYGGMDNDRSATLGARNLMTIRSSNYVWGAP